MLVLPAAWQIEQSKLRRDARAHAPKVTFAPMHRQLQKSAPMAPLAMSLGWALRPSVLLAPQAIGATRVASFRAILASTV